MVFDYSIPAAPHSIVAEEQRSTEKAFSFIVKSVMRLDDHIKRSGGAGTEVHAYLDQYYPALGHDHRVVLHHKIALKLIASKFGPEAVPIAEQHIRDDCDGKLPESYADRNYYRLEWSYDPNHFEQALRTAKELCGQYETGLECPE